MDEWLTPTNILLSLILITLLRIVWVQGKMRTIAKLHLLSSVTDTGHTSLVGPSLEALYGYDSPHFKSHWTYLKSYVSEKL